MFKIDVISVRLIFALFLCFISVSYSQEEASIWYFGFNAGVQFNAGSPDPIVLNDGQLSTEEGCSTISDSNGNLLFYSDGITVWDKMHNVMPNGTGLRGDPSSTQSGIIVPKPNNPDVYYIFTVVNEANAEGLCYSEVDMNLNGGNGDVTSVKNVELLSPSTEKISAVMHGNDTDIWVIGHGWENNSFLAYRVTPSGVNVTPVISNVGEVHGGNTASTIGYLKFSPDGQKLAVAKWSNNSFVEILDFDDTTGAVSNPVTINGLFYLGVSNGAYGIEFSPDSSLLYVGDTNFSTSEGRVHQFDVTQPTANAIINSQTILNEGTEIPGALQLAINGKIYISNTSTGNLDVIESPNELGANCNYVSNVVDLSPGIAVYGLPPFIQSFFSVAINVENVCLGSETEFFIEATDEIESISWDFGDGNTSTEEIPTHIYQTAGDYVVSVTVSTTDETKTFERDISIYSVPVANQASDYILCDIGNDGEESFDLNTKTTEILGTQSATDFEVMYYASMEDAENKENELTIPYLSNNQEVFARIYNAQAPNCYDISSFNLILSQQPEAQPIQDIITCDNEIVDGSETIVFNTITPIVLGNQDASLFNVSYHLNETDAENNNGNLPTVYTTVNNPQEIFVRIENTDNNTCYDVTSFNVFIEDQIIAYTPENMFACDDASNDGVEVFNLTNQENAIINGQSGDYIISYYSTETDAILSENAISNTYQNTSSSETIFARIEKDTNANCFDVTSFEIAVLEYPEIIMPDSYNICTNETVILRAPIGFNSYSWSTGETTKDIIVTQPGDYTVIVTKVFNTNPITECESSKTIQVIESDEAIFETFEIQDWTDNSNSIAVFVTGLGDYEYSLDNIVYQDNPVFYNLEPGEYSVFIRDKNGCGVIYEDIYLMYYPKFFTPNDDGYNDFWQIKMASHEPGLEIYIHDRHGKLLTKINPNSLGWDGTFNGELMPTNDYWFVVKRPSNGKTYKGHFTLKR
ncbi:T9SS type B sorting domain-containing protein [Mangrovimonas cancribranchiae]|uniref:T9SS type B sorting domain-containing protein n=1 Tax=Mangrovimonas cancribranchiae TaxID=3080055 RepID=A0AAU6P0Z6_9FLAO